MTTTDRFVIEHFDGLVSTDPRVREHIAFVRRQDAFASRNNDERSYVIPGRCDACALIVEAHEAGGDLAKPGEGR